MHRYLSFIRAEMHVGVAPSIMLSAYARETSSVDAHRSTGMAQERLLSLRSSDVRPEVKISGGTQLVRSLPWSLRIFTEEYVHAGIGPLNELSLRIRRSSGMPSRSQLASKGPERSLSLTSSLVRLVRPTRSGRPPTSPFLPTLSSLSLVRAANSVGIIPVSVLWLRSRNSRLVSMPISVGIGHEKSLASRLSFVRDVRRPTSEGMQPSKPLFMMSSALRLVRAPISLGSGPVREFAPSSRYSREVQSPMASSMVPERELE
mmetsp:Transcript_25140/g.68151  ORF Transcript_25140/g.68151 Transcript_25140/m.68151 type:complete len:261 (-) Transcript_25140:307-1089(-)